MTIYQAICNAKEVWATMARVQRTDFQSLTGLEVCWRHGNYWRKDETPLVNVYRSIWQAMGVELQHSRIVLESYRI